MQQIVVRTCPGDSGSDVLVHLSEAGPDGTCRVEFNGQPAGTVRPAAIGAGACWDAQRLDGDTNRRPGGLIDGLRFLVGER